MAEVIVLSQPDGSGGMHMSASRTDEEEELRVMLALERACRCAASLTESMVERRIDQHFAKGGQRLGSG